MAIFTDVTDVDGNSVLDTDTLFGALVVDVREVTGNSTYTINTNYNLANVNVEVFAQSLDTDGLTHEVSATTSGKNITVKATIADPDSYLTSATSLSNSYTPFVAFSVNYWNNPNPAIFDDPFLVSSTNYTRTLASNVSYNVTLPATFKNVSASTRKSKVFTILRG